MDTGSVPHTNAYLPRSFSFHSRFSIFVQLFTYIYLVTFVYKGVYVIIEIQVFDLLMYA